MQRLLTGSDGAERPLASSEAGVSFILTRALLHPNLSLARHKDAVFVLQTLVFCVEIGCFGTVDATF